MLALAILTLAYLPDPPLLIGIEEPERGVHPRLLRNIQTALYRLSYPKQFGEDRQPVQVIATTHSPYFLDLYKDHPEEIVIAQKTSDGANSSGCPTNPTLWKCWTMLPWARSGIAAFLVVCRPSNEGRDPQRIAGGRSGDSYSH